MQVRRLRKDIATLTQTTEPLTIFVNQLGEVSTALVPIFFFLCTLQKGLTPCACGLQACSKRAGPCADDDVRLEPPLSFFFFFLLYLLAWFTDLDRTIRACDSRPWCPRPQQTGHRRRLRYTCACVRAGHLSVWCQLLTHTAAPVLSRLSVRGAISHRTTRRMA